MSVHRSPRSISVLAAALVLASVGLVVAWVAFTGGGPAPSRTATQPGEPDEAAPARDLNPRVSALISVGSWPRDIAVGEGAVWVTVNDLEGPSESFYVAQIDPKLNEVTDRVPIVEGAGRITVAHGSLWVVGFDELIRLDPTTKQVAARIPTGRYAIDVTAFGGAVWATRDIDGRTGELLRIDPTTNSVASRVQLEGRIRDVVAGEGALWVVDSTSTLHEGPSLLKIDPQTLSVTARIEGLAGLDVAPGPGTVWVQGWLSTYDPSVGTGAGDHPVIMRIDEVTGERWGPPVRTDRFHPFAADEHGVWFVGENGAVSHLNAESLEVDASTSIESVAMDTSVRTAVDSDAGIIWIANYRHSVTRIDLF